MFLWNEMCVLGILTEHRQRGNLAGGLQLWWSGLCRIASGSLGRVSRSMRRIVRQIDRNACTGGRDDGGTNANQDRSPLDATLLLWRIGWDWFLHAGIAFGRIGMERGGSTGIDRRQRHGCRGRL